jgi:hypothetical protein
MDMCCCFIVTFATYEAAKHQINKLIYQSVGVKQHQHVMHALTFTGFASICSAACAAGAVQYAVGHWWDMFASYREAARASPTSGNIVTFITKNAIRYSSNTDSGKLGQVQWTPRLRAIVPPLAPLVVTLPAQMLAFLAFEYGKSVLHQRLD